MRYSFESLREFIDFLSVKRELCTIEAETSCIHEITEIHSRILAKQGPALLFRHVTGSNAQRYSIPLLTNLFGSRKRVAWGLGIEPEEIGSMGEMLASFKQPKVPASIQDGIRILPKLKYLRAMRGCMLSQPPCQQIVQEEGEVDLSRLPVQSFWPGEPGPLITWGMVVTKGPSDRPEDGYNLGIYRMQVLSRNKVIMRWLRHRGGAQHFARWKQARKDPFPVAVVIGPDPATLLAAVMPVPDTLSEYHFAGLIRGKKLDMARCVSVPLEVPAHSEIVLEGYVSLEEDAEEGPYADHTGYFNSVERFPVCTFSAMTMRRNPIYISTLLKRPPDEPSVISETLNDVFVPLIRQQFPEIIDFWLPPEACSYRIAVVSIRKAYPGHARRIMMGIWSYLRQFSYTKFIIVVDSDINVRNWQDVIWAISTRADPYRDTLLIDNTPIDYLDFASPVSGLGGKMGIDATNKIPPETNRNWGRAIKMSSDVIEKVNKRWKEYGIPD